MPALFVLFDQHWWANYSPEPDDKKEVPLSSLGGLLSGTDEKEIEARVAQFLAKQG